MGDPLETICVSKGCNERTMKGLLVCPFHMGVAVGTSTANAGLYETIDKLRGLLERVKPVLASTPVECAAERGERLAPGVESYTDLKALRKEIEDFLEVYDA